MYTDLNFKRLTAGSGRYCEPRHIGDIIRDVFLGNENLAEGYRKFLASKDGKAEKGGMNHEG